jgi:hypothetical protein
MACPFFKRILCQMPWYKNTGVALWLMSRSSLSQNTKNGFPVLFFGWWVPTLLILELGLVISSASSLIRIGVTAGPSFWSAVLDKEVESNVTAGTDETLRLVVASVRVELKA